MKNYIMALELGLFVVGAALALIAVLKPFRKLRAYSKKAQQRNVVCLSVDAADGIAYYAPFTTSRLANKRLRFRCSEQNEEFYFSVPYDQPINWRAGDKGTLTFVKDNFVSFEKM